MVTFNASSRAKIRTSMGDLLLEFLVDKPPRTIENFLSLVHRGYYDGLTLHRVVKDFMVQGGCRNGDGTGKAEYTIRPEFNETPHVKGVVSMARNNDPHSAFSQFFVCLGELRYLDSRYTAFARVIDGLDVLDKIASAPVFESKYGEKSVPRDTIYINGVDLEGVEFDARDEASPPSASGNDDGEGEGDDEGDEQGGDGDGETEVREGSRSDQPAEGEGGERKGRRTRRGGRGRRKPGAARPAVAEGSEGAESAPAAGQADAAAGESAPKPPAAEAPAAEAPKDSKAEADGEPRPKPKKKAARRRPASSKTKSADDED